MCTPAHCVYMPQWVCTLLETTCGSKDLFHVVRLGSKHLSPLTCLTNLILQVWVWRPLLGDNEQPSYTY